VIEKKKKLGECAGPKMIGHGGRERKEGSAVKKSVTGETGGRMRDTSGKRITKWSEKGLGERALKRCSRRGERKTGVASEYIGKNEGGKGY